MSAAQLKPTPAQYVGRYQPSKAEMDTMFTRARKYQEEIIKVKKDVTYEEKERDLMNNLSRYDEKRAASQELFDLIEDSMFKVSKITKSSAEIEQMKDENAEDHLRRNVIMLRSSLKK